MLTRSPPTLASPMTLAPDACACNSSEEKSEAPTGWRTDPMTEPPAASMTCVASRCKAAPKEMSTVMKNHGLPPPSAERARGAGGERVRI
jgi:hypothetical protein